MMTKQNVGKTFSIFPRPHKADLKFHKCLPSYPHSFYHTLLLPQMMTDLSVEKEHLRNLKN